MKLDDEEIARLTAAVEIQSEIEIDKVAREGVRVGCARTSARISIECVRTVMAILVRTVSTPRAKVLWITSGISSSVSDIGSLLATWNMTGEPPVLPIVGIDLGSDRHRTRGLALFAGFECEARFHDNADRRSAAINLSLFTCRALMDGGLDDGVCYEGLGGQPLRIIRSSDAASGNMVAIILPSVRNGAGSN